MRYISFVMMIIFSTSICAKNIKNLYADFYASMGKGTRSYAKKYSKKMNKEGLGYLKNLYEKNSPRNVHYSKKPKIKYIIHQIWVGDNPVPETYQQLKKTWLKCHPGWHYKLWTNDEVAKIKLYNQKYYDQATEPAEKANILRYELLYKYGGIYVDIDFEALTSLEPLHHCYDFYTGIEPNDSAHLLNNALIGCSKGHPLMRYCIETIKDDMHLVSRFHRNGVGHFSRCFIAKAHEFPGVTIALPSSYFYPLNLKYSIEQPIIYCLKPESFAVHYWAYQMKKNGQTELPKLGYIKEKDKKKHKSKK